MAQKELVYKVKIVDETGNIVEVLAQDINTLNKSVKDLENELNGTELGSEQFKDLQKELKNSKGALDEAKKSGMSFSEQLSAIPGPIGSVIQGVKGMGTAFKALIMNPIGAVIAAIALVFMGLFKALTSTEKGMFALNKVMGALSGLLDPIIKLAQSLAMVLVEGVLKGLEAVQKAMEFLGFEQFAQASKDASKLANELNRIDEREGDIAVKRAKQNKELAEAREIIADTNNTLKERLTALEKVRKDEESLAAEEAKNAQDKLNAIRFEQKLKGKSKELLDAEEAAEIALLNTQQSQAAVRRKNIKLEQSLNREAASEKKEQDTQATEKQKEKDAAETERLKKLEESVKFEKALKLSIITDAEEKQKQVLKDALDADKLSIDSLLATEEKKVELKLLAEQKYQQGLDQIQVDKDLKEKEKTQKEYDAETARLDALLELERMKYDGEGELAEADIQKTLDLMRQKTEQLLQNDKLTAEQRLLIEGSYADAVKKLENDVFDARKLVSDKTIQQNREAAQASAQALMQFSYVAGQSTLVGKAAAIAGATINTYLAASQVLADEKLPTFLKPFAVVAAVAAGLKQVAAITAVQPQIPPVKMMKFSRGGMVLGQGTGTLDTIPAMLADGESVINARSTAMFAPVLDTINQLGGGATFDGSMRSSSVDPLQMELLSGVRQNNTKPIRAFVVASEASTQIQLERQTKNRSLV